MVNTVEHYIQKDGNEVIKVILKPTRKGIIRYFYADEAALDLVNNHGWGIRDSKHQYVTARFNKENMYFHKEIMGDCLGECIDHVNGVCFDNVYENLNDVTTMQNLRNSRCRGYGFDKKTDKFSVGLLINGDICTTKDYKTELEALQVSNYIRSLLHADYDYNFLLDRRDDLDILDLERTGQISAEEAIYRHVIRYAANNAWYIYRYGLQEYCRDNHIKIPEFDIDEYGYMIDKLSGVRLCPYETADALPNYNNRMTLEETIQNAREVHKKNRRERDAKAVKLIMRGYTRLELEETLDYSKSTLTNITNRLNREYFEQLMQEFKDTVFENVAEEDIKQFEDAGCTYKGMQKQLRLTRKYLQEAI